MVRGTSQMFITGPAVVKEVLGEEVSMEDLGGAKVHSEVSGVADLVVDDDAACLAQIRRLLGFLPQSHRERPPHRADRRSGRARRRGARRAGAGGSAQALQHGAGDPPPGRRRGVPGAEAPLGAQHGHRTGPPGRRRRWASSPTSRTGWAARSTSTPSDKAARFIRFCDAFNIPLVTLVDVPGFFPGTKQERGGIIRHGAKMLYAYAEATVPKITVYLRKGYGGAKQALCTREMGADQVFVWPGVELAVMGAPAAVNVLYRREIEQAADPEAMRQQRIEEFSERFSGPFDALSKGFAQAALRPRRHATAPDPGAAHAGDQGGGAPAEEARRNAGLSAIGPGDRGVGRGPHPDKSTPIRAEV